MQVRDDEVYRSLANLNAVLRGRGDSARARFALIEADPYLEGEWLVVVTWELPEPASSNTGWPLEYLDEYCHLVADCLDGLVFSTLCLFRTESELRSDAKLGAPVADAAA